jgi:site-specific DNA-methyltransferase (adenine-specific)
VILDEEAAAMLDEQSGDRPAGASRFFYTSKASRSEREAGLSEKRRTDGRAAEHEVPNLRTSPRRNHHPTVKPVDLMDWLCRLVTRPGGVILDPFMGSGSTGVAAIAGGFDFVGCEIEPEYVEIARARIGATCPLLAKEGTVLI